jgi:hypothetical protein
MGFVATPQIVTHHGVSVGGLLLLDQEMRDAPIHVALTGRRGDPRAKALAAGALALPTWYRRVEWVGEELGPIMHEDVAYPALGYPAAFVCSGTECSTPARTPEVLRSRFDRMEAGH